MWSLSSVTRYNDKKTPFSSAAIMQKAVISRRKETVMGLAEKRMLAQVRDDVAPKYQSELKDAAGTKITYDIDWDSFADNLTALENLEDGCFKPMNEIFRKITSDQIGKDAVKDGIKTIRLTQETDVNVARFSLLNGVLSMPWDWQGYAGSFFPDSVREKIESLL